MYEIYNPNDYNVWLSYYGNQALQTGYGMEGYRGTPYQRGASLGSFFKALFRMAVPIFKSAGKQVGKHALAAGANVMADAVKGLPVFDSMKRHSKAETAKMLDEASYALQQGEGLGRLPKSINSKNLQQKSINTRTKDVFSKSRKHVLNRQQIYSQY